MSEVTRAMFDELMFPNYAPADFVPVHGEGVRVWDQQGREYLDMGGGIAVMGVGHSHPAMIAALEAQGRRLWHVSNLMTNEPALLLAQKLIASTFAERVFLCNSGGEANEAALKLARRYAFDHFGEQKCKIVSAVNSFHGRTLFTVSAGGQEKYSSGFGPKPAGIEHVPFNDIEALTAAVDDQTCAVILEPVQGESGVLPATPEYLRAARALTQKHQALLIFDEVQTGVGRTGKLYAYMNYGVEPDILTSAKALGGGFPIGAVLAKSAVAASFSVGVHGTTYGGNPLACAVANAALALIDTPETYANIEARHQQFKAGLEALGASSGVFSAVRGMGLLLGAVLSEHFAGQAAAVLSAAQQEGLLVLMASPNVVRFAPSLLVTEAEIDEALKRLAPALLRVRAHGA